MLVTNFKYFSGINDNFFSTFLFMINVGFTFGSHFCLFFLGSLGSDDMLTGVKKGKRPLSIFYIITIGATSIGNGSFNNHMDKILPVFTPSPLTRIDMDNFTTLKILVA